MNHKKNLILTAHRITPDQKKKAIKVGKGNESQGVREALDSYKLEVRSETPQDIVVTNLK